MKNKLLSIIPSSESELRSIISAAEDNPNIFMRILLPSFGFNKGIWKDWQLDIEKLLVGKITESCLFPVDTVIIANKKPTRRWLLDSIGKSYDGDGAHGAQCKDFVNAYAKWLGHPLKPGDAADVWHDTQEPYWRKIPHTQSLVPQLGDIAVWDTTKNSPYGHVAVVLEATTESFTSVDQNWHNSNTETGSPAALVTHTYTKPNILGYLRPSL